MLDSQTSAKTWGKLSFDLKKLWFFAQVFDAYKKWSFYLGLIFFKALSLFTLNDFEFDMEKKILGYVC